jgi:hypothetical protein
MPGYNFKEEFVQPILTGKKRQTIRKPRKRPTKPGDMIYIWVRMRTKNARKLGEAICQSVTPLKITLTDIVLDEQKLGPREVLDFAQADGFVNQLAFFEFFEKQYGEPEKLDFELIKW